ncbi:MAG TPA: glucosaminidase domain-containing protein, partial [Puia sp.]|nr:glucosaminidase domain-containing protein [Puia sp.]
MKFNVTVLLACAIYSNSLSGQATTDVISYISTYKDLAVSEMQRTGVPASIILAQGIHETQAGTSDLVKKSNNHFGIKCKDNWTGSVVYHDDDRSGECFRSYNSPKDSYVDHSDFLRNSPRYQFLFKLDPEDYQGWAYGLKKAGYATNIRYSQILIKLIEDYNLQQYTEIALGKLKPSDDVLVAAGNNGSIQPDTPPALRPEYPSGEFMINNTRVIYARAGSSLLAIANQYDLPLPRLLEFNDLKEEDVLINDQLLFLQRKRKSGSGEFHIVQNGESMYDICQEEGIRYENIESLNQLSAGEEPAVGERIYLQSRSPSKPLLRSEKIRKQAAASDSSREKSSQLTHVVQARETLYSISQK